MVMEVNLEVLARADMAIQLFCLKITGNKEEVKIEGSW